MIFQPHPSSDEQVRFLRQLQRILSDGGFVSTYKFALLHALADLSVLCGTDSNDELTLSTREISSHLIELYWRQASPFPGATYAILKQNTGKQAAILNHLESARNRFGHTLGGLQADRRAWERLVVQVDRTLRTMPLWKLQTVGPEKVEFLYDNAKSGPTITLKPGVAYCFRAFYDLILDLVRGAWLRFVRAQNPALLGSNTDLDAFLFGSERASLAVFQPILAEIQAGACFYCNRRITGRGEVDHFIPWSRYPVDLGHNFVLADTSCNAGKADYLAAERHLENWLSRNQRFGSTLASAFTARGITHDQHGSREVARWAYSTAANLGSPVWRERRQLERLSLEWGRIFAGT